jgi:hypothetical protein
MCLLGFVLPEQPIDGAVSRNLRLLDGLALALVVPFIKQGIERGRASAFSVFPACRFIAGAVRSKN